MVKLGPKMTLKGAEIDFDVERDLRATKNPAKNEAKMVQQSIKVVIRKRCRTMIDLWIDLGCRNDPKMNPI